MEINMTEYNRIEAVRYADRWAKDRNPRYYDFEHIGGDCTNFISQCLFAGSGKMNYSRENGWYYSGANDRSPSWTGVGFLRKFLLLNKKAAVFAREIRLSDVQIGDVIQLKRDGKYYHSLFVTEVSFPAIPENVRINTHTYDSYKRRLSSYENYDSFSVLHIMGVL